MPFAIFALATAAARREVLMEDLTGWRRVVRRGMAMDRMDPMFALGDVRIVTTKGAICTCIRVQ